MPKVLPGLDALVTNPLQLSFQNRRFGLLTNQTGLTQDGVPAWEALKGSGFNVLALFSPEHGIQGVLEGEVASSRSQEGMPIHSLYGVNKRPTPEMLSGIDAIICDLQDVGARFYTYAGTIFEVIEACASRGMAVVILDRPNPLGGLTVEGPFANVEPETLVGSPLFPITHGMTMGEMALFYGETQGLEVDIQVVQVQGWHREMLWPQTGLTWRRPSPNLPDFESAAWYPGLCLLEFSNFTVGRGTEAPFRIFGRPDFDPQAFLAEFGSCEDIQAEAIEFVPTALPFPFANEFCRGIRFSRPTPPQHPVEFGLRIMAALRKSHPGFSRSEWDKAEKLLGNRVVLDALWEGDLNSALRIASKDAEQFQVTRQPFLLY